MEESRFMEESDDDDDENDDKEEELSPPSHFRSSGGGGGGGAGGAGDGSKHGSEPRLSSVSAMLTGAEPSDVSMALLKAEMTGGEGVSAVQYQRCFLRRALSQQAPTPLLQAGRRGGVASACGDRPVRRELPSPSSES